MSLKLNKFHISRIIIIIIIYYLQLGRHPVAGVITCYITTDYEDFPLNFR